MASTSKCSIAAAPWWRWEPRLWAVTRHGNRIGLPYHSSEEAGEVLRGMGAVPDLSDPLLSGWLLHLLRERTGPKANVTTYSEEAHWVVWVVRPGPTGRPRWERAGTGPTEIDALLSALQGVGS